MICSIQLISDDDFSAMIIVIEMLFHMLCGLRRGKLFVERKIRVK